MATFTSSDNETLDTTPHPTLTFPPPHPKSPRNVVGPPKEYILSYLETRTPPFLRPCRQPYTYPDYALFPYIETHYPTLTPHQQLSVHLLYPASATGHLLTPSVRTRFTRVLIASRRRACGELPGERSAETVIRLLMTLYTLAVTDRGLVNDVLGEEGLKKLISNGETLGDGKVLNNGLTDVEMVRGMGGLVHQALVGAVIENRGVFVKIERVSGPGLGERIGKFAGSGVDDIGEGVDVEGTLRRLAISQAEEMREEEEDGMLDLLDGVEEGIYDDDADDAVLEGEGGGGGESEVVDEPVERKEMTDAGRDPGRGRGRGRGNGRGRGRGRGRGSGGSRGRGGRRSAALKKQGKGMGM